MFKGGGGVSNKKAKDISLITLFSAIIVICSLVTIPSVVPFTLQTFAIFLCLNILGAKKGIVSILIYIFLGVIGLPVFSGFKGGLSIEVLQKVKQEDIVNVLKEEIDNYLFKNIENDYFSSLMTV